MDESQLGENVELLTKPILMSCDHDHMHLFCCHILFSVAHEVLTSNTSSNY